MSRIETSAHALGPIRGLLRRLPFARRLYEQAVLLEAAGYDPRRFRLFSLVRPFTMMSNARLRSLEDVALRVERNGIPGAFVECGVWRGGAAAIMAHVTKRAGTRRKIWLFDSFEGLPEPTTLDGTKAYEYAGQRAGGDLVPIERCVAPLDDVRKVMRRLAIADEDLVIRQGWFQDTLPAARAEIGPVALLRLDGDWYESTRVCLQMLYDSVVPGGYIVLDDYDYWEGCRRAVDEFLAERGIVTALEPIGRAGVPDGRYFVKP